jgi:RHS repeat-associated protein
MTRRRRFLPNTQHSCCHFEPNRSWARNLSALLFVFLASLLPPHACAQVPIGTPPFGSFAGGPDTVNLANLNVNWNIPIRNKAGRGTNFSYVLTYDSSVWYPVGSTGNQSWQPVTNWGWQGLQPAGSSYVLYSVTYTSGQCGYQGQSSYQEWIYSNFSYYDNFGSWHSFPNVSGDYYSSPGGTTCPPNGPQPPPPNEPVSQVAPDGSGYTLYVTMSQAPTAYVTDKNGNTFNIFAGTTPPTSGSTSTADRNGNIISQSNGVYTDTLGTTALTVIGLSPSNTDLSYTAPSGATATYIVKYTSYSVQTNFGCGISEYGPISNSLVSEIDLPDYDQTTNPNSRYTFSYEATPNVTGKVTGRLGSVTLPTGGTITYNYTGGSSGHITCADGSTPGLQRYTPDAGSNYWNYIRTTGSGAASATLITDPSSQANQSIVQFQYIYETQRDVYQGAAPSFSSLPISESTLQTSSLLRETQTCYNASSSPCTTTSITLPINQRNVLTQLGPSGWQGLHVDKFSATSGALTESDDYDYSSGTPTTVLRKILTTYASLGNITVFPQSVTVCTGTGSSPSCNNSGTVVAQTTFNYDEGTLTISSNVAQHTSVSGARGNLTSINYPVNGLTSHLSYWDTGSVNTSQDINGAMTTYNYAPNASSCQMAFPTGITEPMGSPSMTESFSWNCSGAVRLTTTDENGKVTTSTYANDKYFWRPDSISDATNVTVNFCYGSLTNSTGTCTVSPNGVESTLNFNSNNSTVDTLTTLDGLGRTHIQQRRQSPTSGNFDSIETDYDARGRSSRTTLPYSGTAGQTSSGAPAVTTAYDALSRPVTVQDAGGGTTSYSYPQNDVVVTIGPAPSGENTKQRQLEYDGLGRLISICEITAGTTPWPSASCGQNTSATGYLTKYAYDTLGDLTNVTQNAQSISNQQTRSYVFDAMSRLTSETNPESGTTTYVFDSDSTCGTSKGDTVKRTDAVLNVICSTYDALHRLTSITYPSGTYASSTPAKTFVYDSATVNGQAMSNAMGRLAEAYTGPSDTKTTDLGFSYTARGEVSDVYELTPHSNSSYYHMSQSYWQHGRTSQIGGNLTGLPTISYGGTIGSTVGLDGEGRITQVTGASGQENPVTGVSYNGASLPTQVTFGSGDSDIFAYDSYTLRMTQFKFNVGTQSKSLTGTLTWNANNTLGQLAMTDQFNSADTQTCNYSHDDLIRIVGANCGTAAAQTFSYDPFGNIAKSGSPYSFQPTYSAATNRMTSLPGNFTPRYDANGNVTNDSNHTYSWDAAGNSIAIDNIGLTFDAFDRMVEQNRSGTYTEIVYSPTGGKLALMGGTGGQTLQKAFIPLPGQDTAVYTSSGLDHYRHSDWLGSARLTSSSSQADTPSTVAYAPFGESYAQSGTADLSFTGQNADTVSTDYDFLLREYSNEGRWPSPDPAGIAAASTVNPQTFNRYAYVANNPLDLVDPLGLVAQEICLQGGSVGYGYDDGTSEPGYSFPPECYYYDDGMIPTSAQLTPPTTSPTTSPSPGLDISALIAGAAQNRRNCLKNAAQKRMASRFNALNTRAGEFNKHFTRVQLGLMATGCVVGGVGVFAGTWEFDGATIPEGCIGGGLITSFSEGFGINVITEFGWGSFDLYWDFRAIDQQYQQDVQACG